MLLRLILAQQPNLFVLKVAVHQVCSAPLRKWHGSSIHKWSDTLKQIFGLAQGQKDPAFVEDITRAMAARLKQDNRIAWFAPQVENFESIHNHNAFAEVSWSRA